MTVRIGALQGDAWTGLVLSPRPGEGFAFRFAVEKGGATADLDDFHWLVHEVGPHDPDGRYARMSFDLDLPFGLGKETPVVPREGRRAGLVVEWGRVGEAAVVGRVAAAFEGTLIVKAYRPWDWDGTWRAGGSGEAVGVGAGGGVAVRVAAGAAARRSEAADGDAAAPRPRSGDRDAPAAPPFTATPDGAEAVLRIPVAPGAEVRFVAALGDDGDDALGGARSIPLGSVDATLVDAAAAYEGRRARVAGHLDGLAASITDNLHWMVLLQPETGTRYTPAGRRWIFPAPAELRAEARGERDHWTVFGWDSYFNALELAVEAPGPAWDTLLAGLRTAYPNGCVPNWRGRFGGTPDRSQPPVGALAALKLHLRHPDADRLAEAYGHLVRWSDWWAADHHGRPRRRPGPRGLFTWGSDVDLVDPHAPPWERDVDVRQLAAWESGQDDLPTWDEADPAPGTGCLAVDPVDANAYRVLDLECLGGIAGALGRADEAAAWTAAADDLRARVDEHLWDAERETYADRRWDGSFTPCRAASHFLVLAAGIAPPDRAARMVEHLTDPELFWGEFVVPTIARSDPRFEQQQYWRGTIWPPTNYLIRLGLARCGFDEVAGEVAARGARLFLDAWRGTGLCRENFDSRTGEGGGQRHQSWGPLFALAALEEIVDVTPWDGLRVGGLRAPGSSELTRLPTAGGVLDVATAAEGLRVRIDGREVVESRGAVVLRELEWSAVGTGAPAAPPPPRFAALTSSTDAVELRVHLAGTRFAARVDGHTEELAEPRLRLEPGRHRVEVVALD